MREVDPQWLSDQIMIIDFGIAFLQEQSSPYVGTPKSYCAPEFLFHLPRSVSSDIWALGCTIFEIRTGSRLFLYKGKPTRSQTLIAMVKILGTSLPEKWLSAWGEGCDWYAKGTRAGGELVNFVQGTLHSLIAEVGIHDGEYPPTTTSHMDCSLGSESADDLGKGTTSRLIALVGDLTTSEAEEVIARTNKTDPEQIEVEGSEIGSGNSGTKNNSGSSNAKSGDKSISSEGVSTRPSSGNTFNKTEQVQSMNVIGDQSMAGASLESVKELPEIGKTIDLLESAGVRITTIEAVGLENLLRRVLVYLPEERLGPSELAKHRYFRDDFND
jgi:serine/threonine-protein kinase SRPK3